MNYWIFIVTAHKLADESYTPEDILRQRTADGFWGLGEKTPSRKALRAGDHVVFYMGLPFKEFVATATLATDSYQLSEAEQNEVSHGTKFYRAPYGVRLPEVTVWPERKSVEELVPFLNFIENKSSWFAYFQGGVRQISESDFLTITGSRETRAALAPATVEQIEAQTEFALESHLEDFLDKNWAKIDFGSPLVRYATEDQDGRQFPAGAWSIDFLCLDTKTGEIVVLELKRGKSSDSTVGQVLRYMGWVKENLAKSGQGVRGIIIAKEVDDALRYAVKSIVDVSVLTYRIDFKLSPGLEGV